MAQNILATDLATLVGQKIVARRALEGSRDRIGVLVETPSGEDRAKYGVAYRGRWASPEEIAGRMMVMYSLLIEVMEIRTEEGELPKIIVGATSLYGGACYDTIYPDELNGIEQLLQRNGL